MNFAKNPFSLYDFLGYFIPGAFMLITILAATNPDYSLIDYISHMGNPEISLKGTNHSLTQVSKWEVRIDNNRHRIREQKTAIKHSRECADALPSVNDNPLDKTEAGTNSLTVLTFAILAYLLGHFLSYVSAITIEFFSNRLFRYPSKYLLNVPKEEGCENSVWKKLFNAPNIAWKIFLVIVCTICIPITAPMALFFYLAYIRNYLTRSLEPGIMDAINEKMVLYSQKIGYYYDPDCSCCDSHRILMHFVTVHIPDGQRKANNYVALYGFLRSMSLALSILFIMATGSAIRTMNWDASIDWGIITTLLCLAIAPSVSYLGYLKFYRRHTLENLMSFLVFPLSALENPTASRTAGNNQ